MTFTLKSHEAIERWHEIEPLLNRIESTDTPLSSIKADIEQRNAQVWCIGDPIECVWVSRIEQNQDHRFGVVWLGAGDLRMIDGLAITERWFKAIGCKYSQIVGRRGWKKLLPEYQEKAVTLVKTL